VLISAAEPQLPFEINDAGFSEAEIVASESTERPIARIGQEQRLNARWIDLRVPANQAIMRIQSAVCTLFRGALTQRGFVEIHTPKLIPGESEGGSEVFRTDYFGKTACLAQSPQLYKQMAISADLERVFEIGPVFRAENSNTRRHLCEFTGLDIEMAFNLHYNEVIRVLHDMFVSIFNGLETWYDAELATIRQQYPSEKPRWSDEPCIVHWEDAMAMLEEAGEDAPGLDDLNTAQERALGKLVAEKFGTDFFFLDRFPSSVRPFYTMPCADDDRYSNSYDVFLRGEEICSGAQRVHDPELLTKMIIDKGASPEDLKAYIDSMRHGMPPHGGGGIGLERVVFLYLGLDNVRKASMFPRDPNRCSP
jgi:aspartyl-tRNA synthetase